MTEEEQDTPQQESTTVISVCLFIFMAAIVVTNAFVIGILVIRKNLLKHHDLYIIALCTSQLFVGTFVILSTVVQLHVIDVNLVWCTIAPFIELIAFTACIFSLLGITLDRYCSIMHALTYKPTLQRTIIKIMFIMIAAVVYSLRIFVQFAITKESADDEIEESNETSHVNQEFNFCNLLTEDTAADLWFRVFDFFILFIAPIIIMAVMYFKIIQKLWAKNMVATGSTKSKRKAVILSVVCVSTFLLCWLPFYIIDIIHDSVQKTNIMDIDSKVYQAGRYVTIFFALSNSIINPITYGFLSKNFQKDVVILKNQYCCRNNKVEDRNRPLQTLSKHL